MTANTGRAKERGSAALEISLVIAAIAIVSVATIADIGSSANSQFCSVSRGINQDSGEGTVCEVRALAVNGVIPTVTDDQ